ncbi:hypothetical protein [Caulobacter hibisci]|uniref:Uncharacterized protein n=1 Tax=Caulobacter hibisci TaxID=2035993 RepID=A0ABS0SWC9_9CAUL|nr:hypothetical protein [Caulobacter hibisci]MBI1683942.1 hypothetical protein [Caulobacter hibisci]
MPLLRLPLVLLILASATMAAAAGPAGKTGALETITACRAIGEADRRLACYDKAATDLATADAAGDIVVLDRQKVESVRREAFGFNLPKLALFEGKDEKAPALDRIESVAKQAYQKAGGAWIIVLESGAKWEQIDQEPVRRSPKPGSKIAIRKASMGTYFLNIDGQIAIRARRID